MAKLYIQGVTKDFCIEFKQKQTEFLVQYGAETDSLYQKRPTDHEKIDEIQNNIDLIEERSLKGAMVRSRTKFIENEETPSKFFFAAEKDKSHNWQRRLKDHTNFYEEVS